MAVQSVVTDLPLRSSLDQIYKRVGPIPPAICARVANVVVNGLMYLYDVHRIIHRDVKPSNILANSYGQLKICDFGVSGELINSIADTFVGTSTYMSVSVWLSEGHTAYRLFFFPSFEMTI